MRGMRSCLRRCFPAWPVAPGGLGSPRPAQSSTGRASAGRPRGAGRSCPRGGRRTGSAPRGRSSSADSGRLAADHRPAGADHPAASRWLPVGAPRVFPWDRGLAQGPDPGSGSHGPAAPGPPSPPSRRCTPRWCPPCRARPSCCPRSDRRTAGRPLRPRDQRSRMPQHRGPGRPPRSRTAAAGPGGGCRPSSAWAGCRGTTPAVPPCHRRGSHTGCSWSGPGCSPAAACPQGHSPPRSSFRRAGPPARFHSGTGRPRPP
mmetsp:Transcript_1211/g.2455  ORF Transcript_1211/g.2455 Transcript_1211/m.2455 type:complete len:259 (+) Transcript_1211:197-973(+)